MKKLSHFSFCSWFFIGILSVLFAGIPFSPASAIVYEDMAPQEMIPFGATLSANSMPFLVSKFELHADSADAISSIAIRVIDANSSGLTNADFNNLTLWRDDGDGLFDPAIDTLLKSCPLAVFATGMSLTTINGDCASAPLGENLFMTPKKFFVTLQTSLSWSEIDNDGVRVEMGSGAIAINPPGFTSTGYTGANAVSADNTAPMVSAVIKTGTTYFDVVFTEEMDIASAGSVTNYNLLNAPGVDPVTAVVQPDNKTVRLESPTPPLDPITHDFAVAAQGTIFDKAGNANVDTDFRYVDPAVVISEIQMLGDNGEGDEFIELYNRTGADRSIGMGYLRDESGSTLYTFGSVVTIPANSFYLITGTTYNGTVTGDGVMSPGTLASGSNSVTLFDFNGEIYDRVGFTNGGAAKAEGSPFSFMPVPDASMERKADPDSTFASMGPGGGEEFSGNSLDSGQNSNDFIVRSAGQADPQNLSSPPEMLGSLFVHVIFTDPADGTANIPPELDQRFYAGFDQEIDSATFNSSTFYLEESGTSTNTMGVAGVTIQYCPDLPGWATRTTGDVYCDDTAITSGYDHLGYLLPPAAFLKTSTSYLMIVTDGVTGMGGNPVEGNKGNSYYSSAFSLGSGQCVGSECQSGQGAFAPPSVVNAIPTPGSSDVPTNTLIGMRFSEPMDTATLTNTNIKLYLVGTDGSDGTEYPLTISSEIQNDAVIISPNTNLSSVSRYRLKVFGNVMSGDGVKMDPDGSNDVMWVSEFETGGGVDTGSPEIMFVTPADGSTAVSTIPGVIELFSSEILDPRTIDLSTVSVVNTSTSAPVNGELQYHPNTPSIVFIPTEALSPYTTYSAAATSGITDFTKAANPLISFLSTFSTDLADMTAPDLLGVSANDYRIIVSFNIPMNRDPGGAGSVINKANITVQEGPPGTTDFTGITPDSLSGVIVRYDPYKQEVILEGFSHTVGNAVKVGFQNVVGLNGIGAPPLSLITTVNSQKIQGETPRIDPSTPVTDTQSSFGFFLPLSRQIDGGGKILIIFPEGFQVAGAIPDALSSNNADFNKMGPGAPTFDPAFDGDGISVDPSGNSVKIQLDSPTRLVSGDTHDYLFFDISGIVNPSIPKGPETDGYTVIIKTIRSDGVILESVESAPFFIRSGGLYTLQGQIHAQAGPGLNAVPVFLESPFGYHATTTLSDGTGGFQFTGLFGGGYSVFTHPLISSGGTDYIGINPPIFLDVTPANCPGKICDTGAVELVPESIGTPVTVNVAGPPNEEIDIFASSLLGFRVKTITLDGAGNGTETLHLGDGAWFVGVGPRIPLFGNPVPPHFVIPDKRFAFITAPACVIQGVNTCTADFLLPAANMPLRGTVVDDLGNAVPNAEIFAYDPILGYGSFTSADAEGLFQINLTAGTYKIGAELFGIHSSRDVSVSIDGAGAVLIDGTLQSWTIPNTHPDFLLQMIQPEFTISGAVTDEEGNALRGVSVWASRTDGYGFADTISDNSGSYSLSVSQGTWDVRAYVPGFGILPRKTVTVEESNVSGINFSLAHTAWDYVTISGTVTASGVPVQNAYIFAKTFIGDSYYYSDTVSDENGEYILTVPAEDHYAIFAFHPDYGEFPPLVNVNASSGDLTGRNFTIDNIHTITVHLEDFLGNPLVLDEAFFNFSNPGNGSGNSLHVQYASEATLLLKNGVYDIHAHILGIPEEDLTYSGPAVGSPILTVDGDEDITVTLPPLSTVSGTAAESGNPVEGVWVEISNEETGIHTGTKTDAAGAYAVNVPDGDYNIQAIKPGYFSVQEEITVAGNLTHDIALTKADRTVSGLITTNSVPAPFAFVWAEKADDNIVVGAQSDANGNYELLLASGSWKIFAAASGYRARPYSANPLLITTGDRTGVNIDLTVRKSTANPLTTPILPSQGGTVSLPDIGLFLNIPANAFGPGNNTTNVVIIDTTNLMKSSSSFPFGNKGQNISATNSNGTAVKILDGFILVSVSYSKAELTAAFKELGILNPTIEQVKALKLSYWDENLSTWMEMPSVVMVNPGDADSYSDLRNNDAGVAVKIIGTTNHLSIFSTIVSSAVVNSSPGGGTGGGTGGGGGGGSKFLAGIQKTIRGFSDILGTTAQKITVAAGVNPEDVIVIVRNGKRITLADLFSASGGSASETFAGLANFAIGDSISTTALGEADIDMGGFTKIHLASNSGFTIQEVTKEKIEYRQDEGTIDYDFDGRGTGVEFEVHTATVNATIRGTIIEVRVTERIESYTVIEGEIDIIEKATGVIHHIIQGEQFAIVDGVIQKSEGQLMEEEQNLSDTGFRDVNLADWFEPYASILLEKGIITGRIGGYFVPGSPITRAETLKIVLLTNGIDPVSDAASAFPDVLPDDWYAGYVTAAKELGVVEGRNGLFQPNEPVTRAEALKIIFETNDETVEEPDPSFLFFDTPAALWSARYISFASKEGIVQGYLEGGMSIFKPDASVTRAEFAKMITLANDLMGTPEIASAE